MRRSLLLVTTAIILLLNITTVLSDFCVPKSGFAISSTNGRLELGGSAITIKGLNWWGAETGNFAPGGLYARKMEDLLDFMAQNGFNGIRLPFALDNALNPDRRYPNNINYNLNPALQGLTTLEVFDRIFEAAAARGIVILLDQHRFDTSQSDSTPLWYTTSCITNPDGVCKSYTIEDDKAGWSYMVNRYQAYWNFFGVDLFNEPHGATRWGTGETANDWALASAEIGNHIITNFPSWKGLIFVEGIELNPKCEILGYPGCETCTNDGHWWAGNLEGVRCATVGLVDQTRLVYSPHVYASSVYNQPYFSDPDFPNNLEYIYQTHFGFVANATGRAVVVGEWGGPYEGRDKIIQDTQANYFKSAGIDSSFYWALNPNPGGDTDGALNPDWTTPNQPKLDFLARAHPTPTGFTDSGDQVCVSSSSTSPSTPTTPTSAAATKAPATSAPTAGPTSAPTAPTDPTSAPSNPSTPVSPTSAPSNPTSSASTPTASPSNPTTTPSQTTGSQGSQTSGSHDPTTTPSSGQGSQTSGSHDPTTTPLPGSPTAAPMATATPTPTPTPANEPTLTPVSSGTVVAPAPPAQGSDSDPANSAASTKATVAIIALTVISMSMLM